MINDLRTFLSKGSTFAKVEIAAGMVATVALVASYSTPKPTYGEMLATLQKISSYTNVEHLQAALPGRNMVIVDANNPEMLSVLKGVSATATFATAIDKSTRPAMHRVNLEGGSVCLTNVMGSSAGGIVSNDDVSMVDGWIPSFHQSDLLRAIVTIHELAHCADLNLNQDTLYAKALSELYADAVAYTWLASRVGKAPAYSMLAAVRIGAGQHASEATELMLFQLKGNLVAGKSASLAEAVNLVDEAFAQQKIQSNEKYRHLWVTAVERRITLAKPGMKEVFSTKDEMMSWQSATKKSPTIGSVDYVAFAGKVMESTNRLVGAHSRQSPKAMEALRTQEQSLKIWQEQVGIIEVGAEVRREAVALSPLSRETILEVRNDLHQLVNPSVVQQAIGGVAP